MIKLEGYKIIKKIASGGMGDVYKAKHTVLETKVAIKSLHSDLVNDEDFRKRFRKEARIQSRLSHPNIVKLIDFQERSDGLFLIMEYVDGKQLNHYIQNDSGPIPEKELIPLFLKVLSAIKYAHSKKLVHRDIKPSNILVCPDGNVKVIDFGIAKSGEEDTGLTKTGIQVGTVSYMSPEQVNAEKLDILTDIYSLGVTLFQMAVGKAPYVGETNTFKIQLRIVSEPLPNPKDIYPGSTDRLINIINKATQKKKSERYQSCDEFIRSFEEKVQTKKLNKTTEILEKKKPKEKIKKISFFQNKNNRIFFKTITVLLILGFGYQFVVKPFYPEIKNKWNTYQKEREIQKNKDEIAKANKIKQAAEEKRLKKAAAAAAAKRKKELAEKAEADRLRKEADAERIRISNLNAAQLEAERKRQEILALAEADRLRKEADAERIRISNLNAARLEAQRKRQEILAIAEAKRVREEAEAEKIRKEKYNGKLGKEKLPNGDFYEGDWVSGDRTGKGILTFKDGRVYQGDFVKGIRTGEGILKKVNGHTYSGSFKNDKFEGYGVYEWDDGFRYEGNFKNNLQDGRGTDVSTNGVRNSGNWKNGKKILPYINLSGTVTDVKGFGISGATIKIRETDNSVTTDSEGKYTIKVKKGQTIIVSFRGLKNKTQTIVNGLTVFSPTLLK